MNEAWLAPPSDALLPRGQVHLWRATLSRPRKQRDLFWSVLTVQERNRAERFRFDVHRHQYIVGRGLLRWLLGAYLHLEPADIQFDYGEHDKPSLVNNPAFHFNVSHSHDKMLLGFVWDRDIGVDIEQVRRMDDMDDIARRFFSEMENEDYTRVPAAQRPDVFFNCWTRKEAFIKAVGEGLSYPLDQFDVSLLPAEPALLRRVRQSRTKAKQWSMVAIEPFGSYRGAAVWTGPHFECVLWDGDLLKF